MHTCTWSVWVGVSVLSVWTGVNVWAGYVSGHGVWVKCECVSKHFSPFYATHICVSKLTIIGSDNGLSPGRRQAIIWTSAGILLIGSLGTNFSEILIGIQTFSFKKMLLKIVSAKWRPFCLGLNMLTHVRLTKPYCYVQRSRWKAGIKGTRVCDTGKSETSKVTTNDKNISARFTYFFLLWFSLISLCPLEK